MMKERARILAKALMGGGDFVPDELLEDGPVRPLKEMMKTLLALDELHWGNYAFSREPLEGKFTREEIAGYIRAANCCGMEEAGSLSKGMSAEMVFAGDKNLSGRTQRREDTIYLTEALVKSMGVSLDMPDTPVGGGHVIFAQYVEPDKITVFMDAVRKGEALVLEYGLEEMLEGVSVYHLLLAHELFHVVEYQKEQVIYTKTEMVELWKKPFSNRSRIGVLSEIAGMAFAKELFHLSYSPFVMDVLLMYGYSPIAATALYEEIMAL